jgi:hypothetical protein
MQSRQFNILVFILTISCTPNQPTDKHSDSIKSQLAGEWEQIGLFEQDIPMYDTLYYKFNNVDSIIDKIIYGIWTDSGKYEHIYSADTKTFLSADTVSQIEIYHFVFLTDSSGVLEHYYIEKNRINLADSKEIDYTRNFQMLTKESLTYIQFDSKDGDNNIAGVSILGDKLELQWNERVTEKFIRPSSK